jgi:hypothetical protein
MDQGLSRGLRSAGGVIALCLALAWSASGQDSLTIRVEAPPELQPQAAGIAAMGGRGEWNSILDLVGMDTSGASVRVVLAPERSPLAAHVASWVSGYAVPALDTVVLFPGRVPSYPDRNMESLLRHEIAHVLISRAAHGNPVARWFDEGTATVAAREWGIEDGARAALATIGPGPRSLRDVDAAFSGDVSAVARAYAMSAALVRYLLHRHGDTAVARILARIGRGAEFGEAFEAATGEGPGDFARAFFRREAVWTTWVPFLTSSTVLWMAITLLALFAIRRRRERDAALREAWAEEERRNAAAEAQAASDKNPNAWN